MGFFDIGGGFIPWGSGQQALIDIGDGLSFGLATATLIVTDAPGQVGYTITIGQ